MNLVFWLANERTFYESCNYLTFLNPSRLCVEGSNIKYTVLWDTYWLLHPPGSFFVLTKPTQPTTHICGVVTAASDGKLSDKTHVLHRTHETHGRC
jgi:hypothetical protein